jgi:hypothetical protein
MCSGQRHQHEVNGTKNALLCPNIWQQNYAAHFKLQLLHRATYFGVILLSAVVTKSTGNYPGKHCSALALNMLVKSPPFFAPKADV